MSDQTDAVNSIETNDHSNLFFKDWYFCISYIFVFVIMSQLFPNPLPSISSPPNSLYFYDMQPGYCLKLLCLNNR